MVRKNYTIKNIVFDADGTLLHGENPYMELAKRLDCYDEVHNLVKTYLSGELDYDELVDKEVSIFKKQYEKIYKEPPRSGSFERLIDVPQTKEHIHEALSEIGAKKVNLYVLSSGFRFIISELTKTKIPRQNIYANRFLYDIDGELVDIHTEVKGDKIDAFERILSDNQLNIHETAYVGDNAFDKILFNYILEHDGFIFLLKDSESEYELGEINKTKKYFEISDLKDIHKYL